jgi:succinate dehydrogenase/fumarate reductase flavoprotein subunit
MEEIVLSAKIGPPVTKIVGGDIVVEKALKGASLTERHKGANRRIVGKQSLTNIVTEARIEGATRHAKSKTKKEAKEKLKNIVNGIHLNANQMDATTKSKSKVEIDNLTGRLESVTQELKGAIKTERKTQRTMESMKNYIDSVAKQEKRSRRD